MLRGIMGAAVVTQCMLVLLVPLVLVPEPPAATWPEQVSQTGEVALGRVVLLSDDTPRKSSKMSSCVQKHILQPRDLPVEDDDLQEEQRDSPLSIKAETNISFLWNADVSRRIRRENLQAAGPVKLTVVISHCDKPLDWITQFLNLLKEDCIIILDSIHVFSKCGKQVEGAKKLRGLLQTPRNFTVATPPNVGRNDHSYATWIRDSFETLLRPPYRPTDVVLFLKDNNYRFTTFGQTDFLTLDHVVANAVTQGFGCLEQTTRHTKRWRHRTAGATTSMRRQEIPRCMSAFHSLKRLRRFSITEYSREKGRDHTDNFLSPTFANIGDWIDALGMTLLGGPALASDDMPPSLQHQAGIYPVVPVCYGGQFAVSRGQLQSAQRRSVFEIMSTLLSRDDNIIEGHFSERLWSAMFSKPLSEEQLRDFRAIAKHVVATSDSIGKSREGVVLGMRVTNFACASIEDFLH